MTNRPSKRERREAARRARQRRQRLRWLAGASVALAVAVGIVVLAGGSSDQAAAMAPDFELETPSGDSVRLSDYRGKPLALIFMHTD